MQDSRAQGSPETYVQCLRILPRKSLARSDCGLSKNSAGVLDSTIWPSAMKTTRSAATQEERTGKRLVQMPECLASHIGALSAVLFGLARPEEADSEIGTTIEIPEGLIEDLQQQITASLEKLGTQP